MQGKPPRPAGVTLIAVLALLVGISGFFASLAIFSVPALTRSVGVGLGLLVLFSSLIWLLVGWSYFKGKGWGWILGFISSIFSMIFAVGAIAAGQSGGVVGLLIWGFMLYYLTRPRVKAFFRKTGLASVPVYPGLTKASQLSTTGSLGQPPLVSPGLTFSPLPHPSSVPLSQVKSPPASSSGSPAHNSICPSCGNGLAAGVNKCPVCGASV